MTHLSQSPDISQLKSLDLSGVTMTDFRPELLQVLLEKVAATLQDLDLDVWDHGLPAGGLPACPEPLLPAQVRQPVWEPPVHGRHGEAAATHRCAALFKARALSCPSGELQTSGCSPGSETRPASGSAVEILRDLGHPRIIWISLSPVLAVVRMYAITWSPLYTAVLPLPRGLLSCVHLATGI